MIQIPVPTDPDTIDVPLPDAFEQWRDIYLHGSLQKVLVFIAFALLLYLLVRIVRQQITRNIDDVNRRHILKKWTGYAYIALLLAIAIAIFADFLAGLGTILALLVAGIAVSLQDVLKSFVGWLYLSSRSGIEIGSRIEVSGVSGDIIDIGVLKTTMLEVGGEMVYGRQSTGRLVTVPNYRMLADLVVISGARSPFVWQEVRVLVTFQSDIQRAEAIMREAGDELHAEVGADLERGFDYLERRYAFKYGTLTPIVYVTLGQYGTELVLRFLVHVRRRRGSVDRVSRRVHAAFAGEPGVELAYPTYRIHAPGDGGDDGDPGSAGRDGARSGRATAPPPPGAMLGEGGEEGRPPPELLD
jgi:small-conductance mechanosensitive channel